MYTLMTQEHENSTQDFRTIESVAFAHKMGENGGFYKVQLIDENGIIIAEWKAKVQANLNKTKINPSVK